MYIDTPYLNESGIGVDYADFYHFLCGIVDYENWYSHIDYSSKHLRLCREPNVWNRAESIYLAFEKLFARFQKSVLAISYRSNGIPSIKELVSILEKLGKKVEIHQSGDMKYVLSTKQSNEILIVAR